MNKKVLKTIKSCDVDEYFNLVEEYPFALTRCRILKDGIISNAS